MSYVYNTSISNSSRKKFSFNQLDSDNDDILLMKCFEESSQLMKKDKIGSQLYTDDSYKDFKILVENKEIPVHRCILALKSPVLAVMMSSDMLEGKSGQMSIIDFTSRTVEEALLFFYKGEISKETCKNHQILADLLHFGNKYDVEELVDYCIEQIDRFKHRFDRNGKRFLIKNAVSIDSDKILDSILAIFGIHDFQLPIVPADNHNIDSIDKDSSIASLNETFSTV